MLRIIILILICIPQFSWSQSIKNEADLIKQANEHFEEGRFIQALPMFSQLVSLNPKDADYNFKFGTCVIYSGVDRETAIKHLTFATKKSVQDARAHYYLGLAKHLNYDFREAKKSYANFLQKADDKTKQKFNAQRQIEMCTNGEGLLSSITDLVVLDKKEVSESDFFRYYDLEEIGGKIIAKPEELLTKNDKKKGLTGVVHFDRSSNYIFYSSYGKGGDQLDLYRVQPLADGKFSNPQKLKGKVNTKFDEDFAFLHADGETLYFASKGHSSMGGYDVFSASYDVSIDEYNQVENLDFAVNTPDDDLFYMVDSTKTMAYFASGRSSGLDNLNVYKVRVESVPLNLVIIKGDFISQIDESQKNTKISIVDDFTGKSVGEFYTDKSTGNYVVPFERAGTYKFEIEVENSPLIHEGIVEIPIFDQAVALRQELILSKEGGIEKLQIKNYFDEILDEDIAALTQDLLRKKAGLDVNADQMAAVLEEQRRKEAENKVLETARPISEAGVVAGFREEMTIQDIATQMKERAASYSDESENLRERAKEAYAEADIKKTEAAEKLTQGKALIQSADESNPQEYIRQTNEGNKLLSESKQANLEAQSLLEVVKSVNSYSNELEQISEEVYASAQIVETSTDFDEVAALLKTEKERQRSLSKEDSSNPEVTISEAANFTDNELDNLVARIEELRVSENSLELKVAGKKRELEAVSKKSEKERVELELQASENELVLTKEELSVESEKVQSLSYDAENYALQKEYLDKINDTSFDFEGESKTYDVEGIDQEIAQAQSGVLEAQSLIPEDAERVASASEELKERVELKSIQSKVGALASGMELKSFENLKSEYEVRSSSIAPIENEAASQAREIALNEVFRNELKEQRLAIEETLDSNSELTSEERVFLNDEEKKITKELNIPVKREVLGSAVTDERIDQIIQQFASEEVSELESWKEGNVSFDNLEEADVLASKAVLEIEKVMTEKNLSISESTDSDEILSLSREVNELKLAAEKLKNTTYRKEFLSDIYDKQVASNPENELGISIEYRKILQDKIIELDEESKSASPLIVAENLKLKSALSNQLTLQGGNISRLEAAQSLAGADELTEQGTDGNSDNNSNDQSATKTAEQNNIEQGADANSVVTDTTTNGSGKETGETTQSKVEKILAKSDFETPESVISQVTPDYNLKLEEIASDDSSTEVTKIEDTRAINQELISNLDIEIDTRVELLDATENEDQKDALQLQINQLQEVKEKKQSENQSLLNNLEEIRTSESLAIDETAVNDTTSDQIVTDGQTAETEVGSETRSGTDSMAENGVETTVNDTTSDQTVTNGQTAETEISSETLSDANSIAENGVETTQDIPSDNQSTDNQSETGDSTANNDENLEAKPNTDTNIDETPEVNSINGATETTNQELSIEEIKEEVGALSKPIKKSFSANVQDVEVYEADELKLSETYKEFIEDTPGLEEKMKKDFQIDLLTEKINEYQSEETESEKEEKKIAKKVQKLEKKRAKLEVKNFPHIIEAAGTEYEAELDELDQKIIDKESTLKESTPLFDQVEKMRATAEVYSEDAYIYNDLAESSSKDIVKQDELYKEATAKQLAAIESLRKAEWLVNNSEELAELSPQAFNMILEESLAPESFADAGSLTDTSASENEVSSLSDDVASSEELKKEWGVTEEEMIRIRKSSAYVEYESKSVLLETNVEEILDLESEIRTSKENADLFEDQALELEKKIEKTSKKKEKKELTSQMQKLRASAQVAYEKAEVLEEKKETLLAETTMLKEELVTMHSELEPEKMLVEVGEPAVDFSKADAETLYNRSLDLSSAVNETIFTRTKDVYSEARPIPVDVKLPEGLVYKVQIGAFRNPIPQTLYNDFAPVNGEKLSNGITRYTAGIFTSEGSAKTAKDDIRGIGFSDAFVVAYLNGERISLAEARNLGGNESIADSGSSTSNNTTSTSGDSSSPSNVGSDNFSPTESADDYYEQFPNAAEANQIEVLSGLFYTVQIGVYSKPVPSSQIFNISPLNSERLSNSNIRYTSGIYNNLNEAAKRKDQIREIGVTDAFVTAYYNGKRISISAAKRKFGEVGINVLEVSNQVADNRPNTTNSSKPVESTSYVIYIGTFADEVPANIAKAMLFLEESRGIIQEKNGSEVSYYTKPVKSEETAKIIKQEFESYEVYSATIQEVKK